MSHTIYNAGFFKRNKDELYVSARIVVPLILKLTKPKSVVDIGCGIGIWLKAFQEQGIKNILGIDGNYIDRKKLLIPPDAFLAKNLNKPFALLQKFDLAISLEVAEHLPEKSAKNFIKNLVALSDIIGFSAAIPGQADVGIGHVNEQWPSYWQSIFKERGYVLLDPFRLQIFHNKKNRLVVPPKHTLGS